MALRMNCSEIMNYSEITSFLKESIDDGTRQISVDCEGFRETLTAQVVVDSALSTECIKLLKEGKKFNTKKFRGAFIYQVESNNLYRVPWSREEEERDITIHIQADAVTSLGTEFTKLKLNANILAQRIETFKRHKFRNKNGKQTG
jgi:hypothetical protein